MKFAESGQKQGPYLADAEIPERIQISLYLLVMCAPRVV